MVEVGEKIAFHQKTSNLERRWTNVPEKKKKKGKKNNFKDAVQL